MTSIQTDLDPLSAEFLADPYPSLAALREQQPVTYCPAIDMWLVTRFTDVEYVFKHPELFSASIAQAPLMALCDDARTILSEGFHLTPVMSNLDPPDHTRIRKRLAHAFSARRSRDLGPIIERRTKELIDAFPNQDIIDLVEYLCYPLPAQTIFTLIGFPDEDTEQIKRWCADKLIVNWGRPTATDQINAAKTMVAFWNYCDEFVRLKRDINADNLTNALLSSDTPGDPLTEREVASIVFGLSFAGHETTSNLAANAIDIALAKGLWTELIADRQRIPSFIEETLRYASSVIAWRRIATLETVIGEVVVPKDAKLYLSLGSANRDSSKFPSPDTFDANRSNASEHTSFGKGIHFCLGATLARIEVEIILNQLADRFPHMRLASEYEASFPPNIAFRGPMTLPVRLVE